MNYTKLDDYAHFPDDSATLESLFLNEQMIGLLDLIEDDQAKAQAREKFIAAIQSVLPELQQDEKNQPEGGLKILVKSHHVQLREVLLKITRSAFPIAIKGILMAAGVGGGGIGVDVATAAGEAAISVRELIQKLDATELDTCEAILRVITRKEPLVLTVHKANLDEIEAIFNNDPELTKPANLQLTVDDLTNRGVLEAEAVGGTTYYKVTF
jgi:hypothetical protein